MRQSKQFEVVERLKQVTPVPVKTFFWAARGHHSRLKGNYDLFRGLREFFQAPVTLEQAREIIRRSLDVREERFLQLARTLVYDCPTSPYLKLLKIAGCEFSDLQASVGRDGLEATLSWLAKEGVCLTSEEFKGKKDVVRGGRSFRVSPDDFERVDASAGFVGQSSGTKNRPVRTIIPLDWLAARSFATAVFLHAHDALSSAHAVYDSILPGTSINHLLINAKVGKTTDRWFARKLSFKTSHSSRDQKLTTYTIVLAGKYFTPGFPRPEFIDIDKIDPIIDWVVEQRQLGTRCFITTIASCAARIASVALERGISLKDTKFYVAGEPFTEAKEEAIKKAEATATSRYSYGGNIAVGYGCAKPLERDEVHVNRHLLAVISHPIPVANGAQPIQPLLLTTLDSTAPRFLFNVESGDYATLSDRKCGCALEDVGLTQHLYRIRSYEKFTSEGMNYFYGDLFELFEKVLPADFGGAPGDYQLVEEEDRNGQTMLSLRVHPRVPNLSEDILLRRLHEELAKGPWGNQFTTTIWKETRTLRIKREIPYASPRGKLLPLHIIH